MAEERRTIEWEGASGKKYKYLIYPLGTKFMPVGGNYIFAKETTPHTWSPVYIGETGDLSTRFDAHHKAACIAKNGATAIHVHRNDSHADRLAEEADLLAKWNTSCND